MNALTLELKATDSLSSSVVLQRRLRLSTAPTWSQSSSKNGYLARTAGRCPSASMSKKWAASCATEETRKIVLSTGMEEGMELSYQRLEGML